jgi:hypothetical protein
MSKYIFIFLLFFIPILSFSQQPKPLIFSNVKVQPIVENEDAGTIYQYIRTIKVYYKDSLTKPLHFRKGPSLDTYCTDETDMTLRTQTGDEITLHSYKRMSCEILAVFNLTDEESDWIKKHPVDLLIITNKVTDNQYTFQLKEQDYLLKLLNKYNK